MSNFSTRESCVIFGTCLYRKVIFHLKFKLIRAARVLRELKSNREGTVDFVNNSAPRQICDT